MNDSLTFAKLDGYLAGLGFHIKPVEDSHVAYQHPASGAVIVLRPHRASDKVNQSVWAVVRRTLVENGLVEPESLEEWLLKSPA
jgi:predicted RNA binding protein YcfA (HicA-like mRNA interferase family)